MRTRSACIFILIPLLLSCGQKAAKTNQRFLLTNPTDRYRIDADITLSRDSLILPGNDLWPIARKLDGTVLPGQADDLTGDGKWNELALQCSFQPNETLSITIDWVKPSDYPRFKKHLTARFDPRSGTSGSLSSIRNFVPYQLKEAGWGNDKIAFSRIFETSGSSELPDSAGILSNNRVADTYQLKAGKDKDILNIALSTGIGEPVLLNDSSVIPLSPFPGTKPGETDSVTYTLLTSGPVRTVFTVNFYGWNDGKNRYDLSQTVTMWAGRSGYENKITLRPQPIGYALGVGLNQTDSLSRIFRSYEYGYIAMMTHDLVSSNKKYYAGMALIVPKTNFTKTETLTSSPSGPVPPLWLAWLAPDPRNEFTFYLYGAWERENAGYRSAAYFEQFIDYETLYLANPIQVKEIK